MAAPRTDSAASRPDASPSAATATGRSVQQLLAAPVPALAWVALLLAPLLYVIELSGPRWLNLALRGIWVAVVVVIGVLLATRWAASRSRAPRG